MVLKINFNKYNPINVGLSTYIDVPAFIEGTKSVINIKNNDEYCFLLSVVCGLYPAAKNKNKNRTSSYPHFSKILQFTNIQFPIALNDITKFET